MIKAGQKRAASSPRPASTPPGKRGKLWLRATTLSVFQATVLGPSPAELRPSPRSVSENPARVRPTSDGSGPNHMWPGPVQSCTVCPWRAGADVGQRCCVGCFDPHVCVCARADFGQMCVHGSGTSSRLRSGRVRPSSANFGQRSQAGCGPNSTEIASMRPNPGRVGPKSEFAQVV